MLPINSLSGALAQSAQIQLEQAVEKNRQARLARVRAKNVAARAAGFAQEDQAPENQVENSDELRPVHEEDRRSDQRKGNTHKHGQEESAEDSADDGLDLKA